MTVREAVGSGGLSRRGSVAEVNVPGRVSRIHPDGAHMDVAFGNELGPMAGFRGAASLRMYANTGLDGFAALGPGQPIAFYDVADVAGPAS